MKASILSPARSAAAGIPPEPTGPRPRLSLRGSRSSATAATTRCGRSPSAPTSPASGCPPRSSRSRPALTVATSARSSATPSHPRQKRLRRLRPQDLERLYDSMLHPTDHRPALAPKALYEVHLIIRGVLNAAVRRGLVTRNVALVAPAPRMRSIPVWRCRSGPRRSSRRSYGPPQVIGCSLRCGSRP